LRAYGLPASRVRQHEREVEPGHKAVCAANVSDLLVNLSRHLMLASLIVEPCRERRRIDRRQRVAARPRACSTVSAKACQRRAFCSSPTTAPSTATPGAAKPTTASSGLIPWHPRTPTNCSLRSSAPTRPLAGSRGGRPVAALADRLGRGT